MTRHLISFDDGAMTFPEDDLPDVAEAAWARGKRRRRWVFGGGLHSYEEVSVVATDGTVTDGPYAESKECSPESRSKMKGRCRCP